MSFLNWSQQEVLTFFAISVRYGVLVAVLPFLGDRVVPVQLKFLLSLVLSYSLMPALVSRGWVDPNQSSIWGSSPSGLLSTLVIEGIFALMLGYTARLAFEVITFGGNIIGQFIGFSMLNQEDIECHAQTETIAQFYTALAMLLFLSIDGHHLMLRGAIESYRIFELGGRGSMIFNLSFRPDFLEKVVHMSGQLIQFAILMSAPVAISVFAVNFVLGLLAKMAPQLNIVTLSSGLGVLIGVAVLWASLSQFNSSASDVFEWMIDGMEILMRSIKER